MRFDSTNLPAASFHSRYDPYKEAERFVDGALSGREPAVVFIVGGGLNYIGAVLARRLPRATRVLIQVTPLFDGLEVDAPPLAWSPTCTKNISGVVAEALGSGRIAGGVAIIEWQPVLSRFPEASDAIRRELLSLLDIYSSDAATSAYWARRWLANSVRLTLGISREAGLEKGFSPIVVACAGPSLVSALDGLRRVRDSVALWSLASAQEALTAHGLSPDLVLTSDPGFWNGYHTAMAIRTGAPLAMPFSAYAFPDALRQNAILPLDTGISFERVSAEALGCCTVKAAAAGTAAGTAISLALEATSGPILLVGLDLAAMTINDHAFPYAFDTLKAIDADRLHPEASERVLVLYDAYPERSGDWRFSRAFSACARGMTIPAADRARVFRMSGSPVELGIAKGDFSSISYLGLERPRITEIASTVPFEERKARLERGLFDLLESSRAEAHYSVERSLPLGPDIALLLKALIPRASAVLLAEAARGEATPTEAEDAFRLAREALGLFLETSP